MKSILDDLPKKIFDKNAMTVLEIAQETPSSRSTAGLLARTKVKQGRWEQVWKMVNGVPVKAYRLKK